MTLKCECCEAELPVSHGVTEQCCRISRGYFEVEGDVSDDEYFEAEGEVSDDEYIKAELFLCTKCYLEDEDLCRFFNKIGWRVR